MCLGDESVQTNAPHCPAGDDRFANSTIGIGQSGSQCLKRNAGFADDLVKAHVGTGADGQAAILITLTPKGAEDFAALTGMNIGRQFSVVLYGK